METKQLLLQRQQVWKIINGSETFPEYLKSLKAMNFKFKTLNRKFYCKN